MGKHVQIYIRKTLLRLISIFPYFERNNTSISSLVHTFSIITVAKFKENDAKSSYFGAPFLLLTCPLDLHFLFFPLFGYCFQFYTCLCFQTFNELTVEVGDVVEMGPPSVGKQPPPGMIVVKLNNRIGLLPIDCLTRYTEQTVVWQTLKFKKIYRA